eukprot:m.148335 g.148335  ORF g.148335 m.148335 type:complete len:723 (-) comp13255_c0_seq1:287-2455(-)
MTLSPQSERLASKAPNRCHHHRNGNRCNKCTRRHHSSGSGRSVTMLLAFLVAMFLVGDGFLPSLIQPAHALDLPFIPSYKQSRAYNDLKRQNRKVLVLINSNCDIALQMTKTVVDTWASAYGSDLFTIRIVVGDSANLDRITTSSSSLAPQTGNNDGDNDNDDDMSENKQNYSKEWTKLDDEKIIPRKRCSIPCGGGKGQPPCFSDAVQRLEKYILYLPACPDTYPPVKKVMCMWNYVLRKWKNSYDYFMKIDMDTYLNIPNFLLFLKQNPPNKPLYSGRVGTGRTVAIEPFCLGMAYVLSRKTFSALPSRAFISTPLQQNSDVTFSTVIRNHLNLSCMEGVSETFKWTFVNRYWDFHDGQFTTLQFNKAMQSILPLSHVTSSHLQGSSVHPVKTSEDMRTLHSIISRSMLPIVEFKNPRGNTVMPEEMQPLCVYNPSQQYVRTGFYMRECLRERPVHPKKISHAYVVYLPHRKDSAERARDIVLQLTNFGFDADYHEGVDGMHDFESHPGGSLTLAEIGLREAYRNLFYRIIHSPEAKNDGLYLIFEDDITFSPHFRSRLDTLLQDPYCGAFLSSNSGGVLLLGATIWSNGSFPRINEWPGGWNLVNHNLKRNGYPRCYNFNIGVYGSYAQVLDLRAIKLFLTWLNSQKYANRPIDHAFNYIAERGLPVQVAFPYLAVPRGDTSNMHDYNKGNVEQRKKLHQWYYEPEKESEKHLNAMNLR